MIDPAEIKRGYRGRVRLASGKILNVVVTKVGRSPPNAMLARYVQYTVVDGQSSYVTSIVDPRRCDSVDEDLPD
jgi:hypothetical protein